MELDLSKLYALTPFTDDFNNSVIKALPKDKNAVRGDLGGIQGIAKIKLEREQSNNARMVAVYREYQQNILRSGQLRAEIIKGVKAGNNPYRLLLKAVECISLMTHNTVILDIVRADIKSIHGAGLLEEEPLQIELEEVQKRLASLEQADKRAGEPEDSRQRIREAIKSHHARVDQLKQLIS